MSEDTDAYSERHYALQKAGLAKARSWLARYREQEEGL